MSVVVAVAFITGITLAYLVGREDGAEAKFDSRNADLTDNEVKNR